MASEGSPSVPQQPVERWTIYVDGADVYTKELPNFKPVEVVPALVADRLAEALEKIQRSGIEEPYHRNIVRAALDAYEGKG